MSQNTKPADREEKFAAVDDVDHRPAREIGEGVARIKDAE